MNRSCLNFLCYSNWCILFLNYKCTVTLHACLRMLCYIWCMNCLYFQCMQASVCFSACLHHNHHSALTTLGILLDKDFSSLGTCKQLCRQSVSMQLSDTFNVISVSVIIILYSYLSWNKDHLIHYTNNYDSRMHCVHTTLVKSTLTITIKTALR